VEGSRPEPQSHSGAGRCRLITSTPIVVVKRMLPSFGYHEARHGHGEVVFDNIPVPAANMLLGEDRDFEIAQGLGRPRAQRPAISGGAHERGCRQRPQNEYGAGGSIEALRFVARRDR
jgi:acyl-CoA dehydrogenase